MKKGLVFILGLVTGCILTIVILFIIGFSNDNLNNDNLNITMAEHQVPFTSSDRFEVFQVLYDGALAKCESENITSFFTGPVVFIKAEEQNQFYDEQIIEVPNDKKAVQTGTFRYATTNGVEKVVPVIEFL